MDGSQDVLAWPADHVERRAVADLIPYARNARTHSEAQVAQIAASIRQWGWTVPVLVDESSNIIAGHGRVLAAQKLGLIDIPVMIAAGWTEAQRRAYVLADNQLAINAGWNNELLAVELADLQLAGFDTQLAGFSADDVTSLTDQLAAGTASDDERNAAEDDGREKGSLLELVNITIDDPKHTVEKGQHYVLGGRHHLLCTGVMSEWPAWAPLLEDGAIFCPYPGPLTPFGKTADDHVLVMVQPDPYVAGHLLDQYVRVHGEDAVALRKGTAA